MHAHVPCVPDCLSRGRCNAYCPRLQRTLQVGHEGSCDGTIKRSRTLNLTRIQCCPTRCAQRARRLDSSTLKLSTCNVQTDHANKYRESHSKTFASTHADRYYAKRQHARAFDTTTNVECGQVSARPLDTRGMRVMHGEMTQSQRGESEPDRHKGSPSRSVWCVIARHEHLQLKNGRKQRQQRRNARLPRSWWSWGSSLRLLGVAGHLECTCRMTYLRLLLSIALSDLVTL